MGYPKKLKHWKTRQRFGVILCKYFELSFKIQMFKSYCIGTSLRCRFEISEYLIRRSLNSVETT